MKKILFLIFLGLKAWGEPEAVLLFEISKDANGNVLQYEAQMESPCHLDDWHPVKIYWRLENKKTEGLNIFENAIYGLDFDERSHERATGQIRAFKNRKIILPIHILIKKEDQKCIPIATIDNGEEIESVRLIDFDGQTPHGALIQYRNSSGSHSIQHLKL